MGCNNSTTRVEVQNDKEVKSNLDDKETFLNEEDGKYVPYDFCK